MKLREGLDVLVRLGRLLLAGLHLRPLRQDRLDLVDELLGRDAFGPRDLDAVQLTLLLEQALSLGKGERRDRGAAERVHVRVLRDPGDRELLERPLRDDADRVADLVPVLVGSAGVDRHLAPARRPRPFRELQRVEALLREVEPEPEGRRAARRDQIAVRLGELGEIPHGARRRLDARKRAHLVEQRFVEWRVEIALDHRMPTSR